MSYLPRPSFAPVLPPVTASRWLLQCRYDYRQRVWNLPAAELSQTEVALALALARLPEYASALNALSAAPADTLSEFAIPGKGAMLTPSRPQTKPKRVRPLGLRAGKFHSSQISQK